MKVGDYIERVKAQRDESRHVLREFIRFVCDYSNDPYVVKKAKELASEYTEKKEEKHDN